MSKRGISAVVATILMVLVTVLMITAFWFAVIPLVKESYFVDDPTVRFQFEKGVYTAYYPQSKIISLRVSRGADDADIKALKFIISEKGTTRESFVYSVPSPNNANVYRFIIGNVSIIDEISVVPIFNYRGGEKEGAFPHSIENIPTRPTPELTQDPEPFDDESIAAAYSSDLIAYYPFFVTQKDYSDNGLNGVLYGDAKIENGALVLDGDGDHLFLGNDNVLMPRRVTLSAWIKTTDPDGQKVIAKDTLGSPIFSRSFNLGVASGDVNLIVFPHYATNINTIPGCNCYEALHSSGASLDDGSWHHIAGSWNSTTLNLYYDGMKQTIQTPLVSNDYLQITPVGLHIGRSNSSDPRSTHTQYFNGSIDDIMIFSGALSHAEIVEIYNNGRTG